MISAEGLTKRYGSTAAVQDVSFHCEPGTITGFLGPNGAGKSTTLRMLTGLTHPDAGRSAIAGHRFVELPNPSRVVGTLLDASAMHDGRTGRATLRIAADIAGVPRRRVEEVLEQVGMAGAAADRRVGTYSLGMRQRIGIAQAMVAEPNVLVLDEPANGLDPEGIVWMRQLLRGFAGAGGTVLLSSHLLAEVEATVDRLIVIGSGRIVAYGALSELLVSAGLVVRPADSDRTKLFELLTAQGVSYAEREDGALSVETSDGFDAERLARSALEAGVVITELRPSDRAGLEELFFSLTSDNGSDGHENGGMGR